MLKTTAKICLALAVFCAGKAFAHVAPGFLMCEERLAAAKIIDRLVDDAAELETVLDDLQRLSDGRALREAQFLRGDLSLYIDELLEKRSTPGDLISAFADLIVREKILRAALIPKIAQASSPALTILALTKTPSAILADTAVPTGNADSVIQSVVFGANMLGDFWELALAQQAKFMRAIFAGVVGPKGETGVKHLSHSKNFVAVKTYGTELRLYGCLKQGILTLFKVGEHIDGGTSYGRFAAHCK